MRSNYSLRQADTELGKEARNQKHQRQNEILIKNTLQGRWKPVEGGRNEINWTVHQHISQI